MKLFLFCISLLIGTIASSAEFFIIPGTKTLLMMGETQSSDVEALKDYVDQDEITEIILKGPGGNLDAGYAIAEIVLENELGVIVPKDTECASACALIFSAGKRRTLEQGARLGFHLPFILLKDDEVSRYCQQLTNPPKPGNNALALLTPHTSMFGTSRKCLELTYQMGLRDIKKLQRYLDRDGISETVIELVINTPSGDMYWVNLDEAQSLGLAN